MAGFDTVQAWLLMGAWVTAFMLGKELCAGYRQRTARSVLHAGAERSEPDSLERTAQTMSGRRRLL